MKKVLVLLFCMLLVPFTAFGMQALSDAELDSIKAQNGMAPDENTGVDQPAENNDKPPILQTTDTTRDTAGTTVSSRAGSGIAIFINDVVIYSGGRQEIWYQNRNTSW